MQRPGGSLDERYEPARFALRLRGAGLAVPLDRVVAFTAALGALAGEGAGLSPSDVYWAGRCTLLGSPEDRGLYDRAFAEEFLGHATSPPGTTLPRAVDVAYDEPLAATGAGASEEVDPVPARRVRWSRADVLAQRDFSEATPEELGELWQAVSKLRVDTASTPSRRRGAAATGSIDVRRSVRSAMAREGELLELRHRDRRERPRRIVLILDVSGSMEPYARALLRFAHATLLGRGRVEVFAVGTRLTRLTRSLSSRDPDAALAAAAAEVPDWSGGTRLGAALGAFIEQWGQRGAARGATVVVLSDGWDRGEPEVLAEQMARLRRLAHRIVWVNPLRATPGYEPLARGMAAALPYCDRFVDGNSLASLVELADLLAAS